MSDEGPTIYGLSAEAWQSAYRLGIQEFSALSVAIFYENDLVRIAFGNNGPPLDEQGLRGCPVFTHAVTIPSSLALDLSKMLRDLLARPKVSKE